MEIHLLSKDIEKFTESLEKSSIAKVLRTIDLLEQFGHKLGSPHSKKIEKDLFELRIHGVQEIRIFYTFYKNSAILLHCYTKKTQRIPQKEIRTALRRLKTLA